MPAVPSPLTDEQIDELRAELDRGQTPMVWFTPGAVGMDAGRSAKVVALGEPAEGDFIQVRPTGSKDVLSFSATELTLEKPARQRKAAKPEPEPEPEREPEPEPVRPAPGELLVVRERPARKPSRPANPEPAAEPAKPAKPVARSGRNKPPAPVTVTLSSSEEGEWTVDVLTGSKRSVRAQPVPAASVASAAKALGGDIEAAIEGVLAAARDQQRARVAQLEAELEAARQALADLAE